MDKKDLNIGQNQDKKIKERIEKQIKDAITLQIYHSLIKLQEAGIVNLGADIEKIKEELQIQKNESSKE